MRSLASQNSEKSHREREGPQREHGRGAVSGGTTSGEREAEFQRSLERLGAGFAVSVIVLDALKALGPRPALREREMVAAALRKSGDSEVLARFCLGGPIYEREAWERLKDLALGADSSGFTALDLLTEVTSPGAHARVLARGWRSRAPDPRARAS